MSNNFVEIYGANHTFDFSLKVLQPSTSFHHTPYINVKPMLVCQLVDQATSNTSSFMAVDRMPWGCTFPPQRNSVLSSTLLTSDLKLLADPAPFFGQFFLTCPDCPHVQQTLFMEFFFFFQPSTTSADSWNEDFFSQPSLLSSERSLLVTSEKTIVSFSYIKIDFMCS